MTTEDLRGDRRLSGVTRTGDTSPFALGLMLRRAHERAASALLEVLRPLGLELRHFAVLIALNARGPLSQNGLVRATEGDKATMVRVVDDLERTGLVERRPLPGDRRIRAVHLTERGVRIFDQAHIDAVETSGQLVRHLEPGQADDMLALLTRFVHPQ